MKNLKEFGVQELTTVEQRETDGGEIYMEMEGGKIYWAIWHENGGYWSYQYNGQNVDTCAQVYILMAWS